MLLGGPAIRAAADDTTATDEETLDVYTPAWHGKVPDTRPSISCLLYTSPSPRDTR